MKPSQRRELVHVGAPDAPYGARALARCYDIDDLARLARKRLPAAVAGYLDGGSEGEWTMRRNRAAFGDPDPGANTSDCYRSQERADPARAAHPPRPDLPHPPTPGPRCQARSKPAGAGNEGPGVRPLSTRFFPMARHFPWHGISPCHGILLNWLSEIGATVARQPGNDGHL